jgi:hypothetical protein
MFLLSIPHCTSFTPLLSLSLSVVSLSMFSLPLYLSLSLSFSLSFFLNIAAPFIVHVVRRPCPCPCPCPPRPPSPRRDARSVDLPRSPPVHHPALPPTAGLTAAQRPRNLLQTVCTSSSSSSAATAASAQACRKGQCCNLQPFAQRSFSSGPCFECYRHRSNNWCLQYAQGCTG